MMIVDATDLYQIRQTGIKLLNRELGPVAMIRFLQQYQKSYGDYSKERHEWIDKMTVSGIVDRIKSRKDRQSAPLSRSEP